MGDEDDVAERLARLERELAFEKERLTEALAESARLTAQLRMSADALGSEWNRSRLLRERLAIALTSSRGGAFHWHGPTNKFECDDRLAELYGFRQRREMDTEHLVSRAHASDRVQIGAAWSRCVDAGLPFRHEIRIPIDSGGMRWVVLAGKAHECESGGPRCVVGACTDISAARFGQQMKRLADEIPQLIWIASADGCIEYANERWSEYTGRPVRFDDASAMLGVFHRDDQLRIRERWLAAVSRGDAFEIEGRIIDVAGHPRWFLVQVVPMAGHGGVIERWVGTCTEIEAQKRAQIGAVASLGHELRQPLTSIAAALHLVERRAPVVERERCMIERQVSRMGRMVTEMLDGSGPGEPPQPQREPVDVARALAEAVEVCAPSIQLRRLTLVCRLSPGLMVEGDHDHLVQVLCNVIHNAAKHSPDRGSIFVRGWRSKDRAIIEVRDEGDGIEAAFLPRLFEPFVRGESAVAGHGLGLAIARKLVECVGGSITAASDGPGKGCTFTITQPASSPRPDTADPQPVEVEPATASRPSARRVLVVDDSPDVTELLADALRLEGHDVVVAQDSRCGLELALVAPFDVILLDVRMPGMDGCQLARELRARLMTRCPRLIAITGTGRLTDDAALFDRILVKPIDVHLMLALVAGGGRRRRRSSRQPRLSR
ncbi:MAG TPA: ATP-binding protein [Kofleriaceae bacterium]|nr:ATP-binding protein [Kofleriaceae bacterium]